MITPKINVDESIHSIPLISRDDGLDAVYMIEELGDLKSHLTLYFLLPCLSLNFPLFFSSLSMIFHVEIWV